MVGFLQEATWSFQPQPAPDPFLKSRSSRLPLRPSDIPTIGNDLLDPLLPQVCVVYSSNVNMLFDDKERLNGVRSGTGTQLHRFKPEMALKLHSYAKLLENLACGVDSIYLPRFESKLEFKILFMKLHFQNFLWLTICCNKQDLLKYLKNEKQSLNLDFSSSFQCSVQYFVNLRLWLYLLLYESAECMCT
jgi:hypothetical protein